LILLGTTLCWIAAGYALVALVARVRFRRSRRSTTDQPLAVSVLKPLCGAEPRLAANLNSFCEQDYPADWQIVFGVREDNDPAIAVVQELQARHPGRDIQLVIDGELHGSNYKVSNLINIFKHCRHQALVIADSDIEVPRDYLSRVVAPLSDRSVGIVTCLYRGRPIGGLWSRLGASFIDEWFAPSALVSNLFGSRDFAFGATIALHREALAAAGGFAAIADQLADDWWLGELVRRQGLRTVLSECVVATDVIEKSATSLIQHELRWLRTIRNIQPLGYALSFVTIGLPVALIGAALAQASAGALAGLAVTIAARYALYYGSYGSAAAESHTVRSWWLPVLRDFLTFGLFCASFASRRVNWRQQDFSVGPDGVFRRVT
jgi:ceramide glucosyltransferase